MVGWVHGAGSHAHHVAQRTRRCHGVLFSPNLCCGKRVSHAHVTPCPKPRRLPCHAAGSSTRPHSPPIWSLRPANGPVRPSLQPISKIIFIARLSEVLEIYGAAHANINILSDQVVPRNHDRRHSKNLYYGRMPAYRRFWYLSSFTLT